MTPTFPLSRSMHTECPGGYMPEAILATRSLKPLVFGHYIIIILVYDGLYLATHVYESRVH